MIAEIWRDIKTFYEKKWFLPGLVLVMVLSYVTLLHNPTMGIDDTSFNVYYEQGVSPAMGRWCLFLINKFFPLAYNPYIVELAGLLCFCVSISLWCVAFYRILGNRVSCWVYLAFGCMMISNPIISEVVIWYLQDGIYLGYGAAALAVIAAVRAFYAGKYEAGVPATGQKSVAEEAQVADGKSAAEERLTAGGKATAHGKLTTGKKAQICSLAGAVIFLTIAMGFYESFIIVWIMGLLMCFMLIRMTGREDYICKPFQWIWKSLLCMVSAVVLRTVIVELFIRVYHLQEEATILRSRGLHEVLGWFDGSKSLDDFAYVMKDFFVKYYVNAIVYLPVMLLVLAIGILGLTAIRQTIKRKDGWILTAAAGIVLVPWVMPILEGVATYYRSSQYMPLLTAFGVLLAGWGISEYSSGSGSVTGSKPGSVTVSESGGVTVSESGSPAESKPGKDAGHGKVLRRIAVILLCIVLYNQIYEMNRWLYIDAMKYEDTKTTLEEVALQIESELDASKPVCVIGEYQVPADFMQESYCPSWSKKYMLTEWIVNLIDESIFDSYCSEYGYAFAETPRLSFITWGSTAFFGFDRELVKFWNMHGHAFTEDGNIDHYNAAKERMKDGPVWPKKGSVVEMEDHIVVNFGY